MYMLLLFYAGILGGVMVVLLTSWIIYAVVTARS